MRVSGCTMQMRMHDSPCQRGGHHQRHAGTSAADAPLVVVVGGPTAAAEQHDRQLGLEQQVELGSTTTASGERLRGAAAWCRARRRRHRCRRWPARTTAAGRGRGATGGRRSRSGSTRCGRPHRGSRRAARGRRAPARGRGRPAPRSRRARTATCADRRRSCRRDSTAPSRWRPSGEHSAASPYAPSTCSHSSRARAHVGDLVESVDRAGVGGAGRRRPPRTRRAGSAARRCCERVLRARRRSSGRDRRPRPSRTSTSITRAVARTDACTSVGGGERQPAVGDRGVR